MENNKEKKKEKQKQKRQINLYESFLPSTLHVHQHHNNRHMINEILLRARVRFC